MTQEVFIHPTAIVEEGAELDTGVFIGPYCFVGKNVKIGKGTQLKSHVVIAGYTFIGEDNEIYPFASLGHAPQDLKYKGEPTTLHIGNRNKIREYCTMQPGTLGGGGKTIVGDENLFMASTHVAHDCLVGNQNVMANSAALAGHVRVCNQTVIGGLVAVHQFCTIGDMAMVGLTSVVVQDVPPFAIVEGNRARLRGMNIVAMRRRGLSSETIQRVRRAMKILFYSGYPTVDDAVAACDAEGLSADLSVKKLIEFVQASKRGVTRPKRGDIAEGLNE